MIFNDQEILPATDSEIDVIRGWSLRGTPTSAPITLSLIERIFELQVELKGRIEKDEPDIT